MTPKKNRNGDYRQGLRNGTYASGDRVTMRVLYYRISESLQGVFQVHYTNFLVSES